MHPIDRFQALIRHPDYCNDPRLYPKLIGKAVALDLPALLTKRGPVVLCSRAWKVEFHASRSFHHVWGLRVAVDPKNPEAVADELAVLSAHDYRNFRDDLRGHDASDKRSTPDSAPKHFADFRIDLELPIGATVKLVKKYIAIKRSAQGVKEKKQKPHEFDIWKVWDRKKARATTAEIAEDQLKVKRRTTPSATLEQSRRQVERAYAKAQAMVEKVGTRRNQELPAVSGEKLKASILTKKSMRWFIEARRADAEAEEKMSARPKP